MVPHPACIGRPLVDMGTGIGSGGSSRAGAHSQALLMGGGVGGGWDPDQRDLWPHLPQPQCPRPYDQIAFFRPLPQYTASILCCAVYTETNGYCTKYPTINAHYDACRQGQHRPSPPPRICVLLDI